MSSTVNTSSLGPLEPLEPLGPLETYTSLKTLTLERQLLRHSQDPCCQCNSYCVDRSVAEKMEKAHR